MSRKIIAAVLALSALTLGGCSQSPAEATEQVSVTEADLSEITAASVSESVTEESTTKAVEETSSKTAEEEVFEIKVTSADEVYEVYPKRIIYPEKSETNITAKKAEIIESFEKDGAAVNVFSAVYPVFSGGDEAAVRKINEYIKNYVDEIYNELKQEAENYVFEDGFSIDEFPYSLCGFLYERSFTAGDYHEYRDDWDYEVNGNILSVYFEDYEYGAGAAHGYETPMPMVFDLRSGERVDFNKIIVDADGLSEALSKALFDYRYAYTYTNSAYRSDDADKYAEYNGNRISNGFRDEKFIEFGTDEEGNYIVVYCPANDRIIIKDGCLSFYLSPYQYGSYADGIRRVDLPINDILPYLNEAGKSLFDGCVSAESEPANVIEYRGKRYFDNIFPVLTIEVDIHQRGTTYPDGSVEIIDYDYYWRRGEFPPKFWKFTDSDYEFMGLFPDVGRIELHGCSNIDFEKLAKIKNIDNIT
ncbi:MAG: DUF4163 domain-containing protein, partial [Oscillospiraceae bacterium]|nr:DUF4163 domain-containing protein [Oscillospiraceae bacterium]